MLFNLQSSNNIGHLILSQLRDAQIQMDRHRFRNNLRRLGSILAYQLSHSLDYVDSSVETPLGVASTKALKNRVVIATILRAGLPMQEGVIELFDEADAAFIAAYRKHHKDGTFKIRLDYLTCPDLDGCDLILVDPMVATGASTAKALEAMEEYGTPNSRHLITAVAANEGIEHLRRMITDLHIWVGAIDEELTAKSYIVPGLGDAGDLCFGPKLQS